MNFWVGVRIPILGKSRPYGTVRKSIGGDFLYALHSNFSSIFTRFRDIAAYVLQHATSLHPTSSPQNFPMFPWE